MVDLIQPAEPPPLDADLNLLTDTVKFYWASSVRLILHPGNQRIQSIISYLDNKEVLPAYNGSAYITTVNFTQPGVHKFRMTIVTSSGTGSLADVFGAEAFQYDSREWILVAQALNTNLNISYQIDENGINFSWKEYDGIDFKAYRLKELSTRNSYDILTNSFQDTNYSGEQTYYDLYVVDNENKEHLWGRCTLNKYLPALRIGNINNRVTLIWNKPLLKKNIAEYQLFQRDNISNWSKIGTLSNNDTSFLLSTASNVFGQRLSFYLYCVPNQYSYIDNTSLFSSFLNYVNVALPGPKFDDQVGFDCLGFYFDNYSASLKKSILYRYTISDDQVKAICDYTFFYNISPNSRYLLIPGDSIVDLYDLNANSIVKSVNMKKIASGYYPALYPKISDNGICVFNSGNVIYVYDFLNENLIATKSMISQALKISPKGKYICVTKTDSIKIYRINENSMDYLSGLKKSAGIGYTNYNFFPDQDDYLYLYSSPTMSVMSCQDLSLVRSMNIGEYFFNIDFCSHKILTAKNGSYWNIYDFNTGNLLQTIKTEIGAGASNFTLLTQNTIFYTGYKYYLDK